MRRQYVSMGNEGNIGQGETFLGEQMKGMSIWTISHSDFWEKCYKSYTNKRLGRFEPNSKMYIF